MEVKNRLNELFTNTYFNFLSDSTYGLTSEEKLLKPEQIKIIKVRGRPSTPDTRNNDISYIKQHQQFSDCDFQREVTFQGFTGFIGENEQGHDGDLMGLCSGNAVTITVTSPDGLTKFSYSPELKREITIKETYLFRRLGYKT